MGEGGGKLSSEYEVVPLFLGLVEVNWSVPGISYVCLLLGRGRGVGRGESFIHPGLIRGLGSVTQPWCGVRLSQTVLRA